MIKRVGKVFPTLFICVQRRVSQAPHWTVKKHKKVDENTFWMYNECVDRIWMTMYLGREV